jgi:hypothetical protein
VQYDAHAKGRDRHRIYGLIAPDDREHGVQETNRVEARRSAEPEDAGIEH